MSRPLRRTRGDLIAVAVISILSVALVALAWITAPIRSVELTPAQSEHTIENSLPVVPHALVESFRLPDLSPGPGPVIVDGLIITYSDKTIAATTPAGERAWTYRRNNELCALSEGWGHVIATYRTAAGCGDVVSINASTGQYAGTRSAIAPDQILPVESNNAVGYVSPSRVELWRSDLVRTVEYGFVEAPQESGFQPHQCDITSALSRKDALAVTEVCENGSWLRLMKSTPEDSRKPEVHFEIEIPSNAYLVAISPDAAAIYDPADSSLRAFDKNGNTLGSSTTLYLGDVAEWSPSVTDLSHYMSYFGNGSLVLFEPSTLAATAALESVLGTGIEVADKLLIATDNGVAVAHPNTAAIDRVISVDRGNYQGPVMLGTAGNTVVEKRGDEVVVLAAD